MVELKQNLSVSKEFDAKVKIKKKKKVYRPPMDHPWRRNTFDKFAIKQKHMGLSGLSSNLCKFII